MSDNNYTHVPEWGEPSNIRYFKSISNPTQSYDQIVQGENMCKVLRTHPDGTQTWHEIDEVYKSLECKDCDDVEKEMKNEDNANL